jgi:hypothetical protein
MFSKIQVSKAPDFLAPQLSVIKKGNQETAQKPRHPALAIRYIIVNV